MFTIIILITILSISTSVKRTTYFLQFHDNKHVFGRLNCNITLWKADSVRFINDQTTVTFTIVNLLGVWCVHIMVFKLLLTLQCVPQLKLYWDRVFPTLYTVWDIFGLQNPVSVLPMTGLNPFFNRPHSQFIVKNIIFKISPHWGELLCVHIY